MENKLYSDSRWWDNPQPMFSRCGECTHYRGFGKCDIYPEKIPPEILRKSFIRDKSQANDYCAQFEEKEA